MSGENNSSSFTTPEVFVVTALDLSGENNLPAAQAVPWCVVTALDLSGENNVRMVTVPGM